MDEYFGIKFEFSRAEVDRLIIDPISRGSRAYICVVDSNVVAMTYYDSAYRRIVNGSLVNVCDGSVIAFLAGLVYRKRLEAFPGPVIFQSYVENPTYNQLVIGNSEVTWLKMVNKLRSKGISTDYLRWLDVPFCDVDDFDFIRIADQVNKMNPDIIWVSLGAPKQEVFMSRLLPYLNRGIMLGIGAAVNFYVGDIGIPKMHIGALNFVWACRVLHEPTKQIKRLIRVFGAYPVLLYEELGKARKAGFRTRN